jgi:hypothetical protein
MSDSKMENVIANVVKQSDWQINGKLSKSGTHFSILLLSKLIFKLKIAAFLAMTSATQFADVNF